jgi:PKD repeat protein
MLAVVLIIVALLGCGGDSGTRSVSTARITSVSPGLVFPGQSEVEGRIYGSSLEGMSSVSLGDGITLQQAEVFSPSEIRLLFSVSENASPGPRSVTVFAVEGTSSLDNAFTISSNRVPRAAFFVSPPSGFKSTVFLFDGSNSADPDGSISNYRWDFDDGRVATGKTVTHQFSTSDLFNVRLTVTDSGGATATDERFVDVAVSQPPQAQFTISPSSGTISTDFDFDASNSIDPDGNITTYLWSFGDGTSASGRFVTHRYSQTGGFSVTLSVKDNSQLTASTTRSLLVDDGGGGGGGTGEQCTESANRQPILYGTLISEDRASQSVIVQFPSDTTCREAFVRCGDFRKTSPERFYGIVQRVFDLGNGRFQIFVDCPPSWPSEIGEGVFIIYKTCADNFCPP